MPRPSNRDAILDAALDVAGRAGMSGVTYDAIGEAAGVSRGGLLYHFPSKEDLIDAMVEYMASSADALTLRHLDGIAYEDASTAQRLTALVDATVGTTFDAGHLAIYVESMREARHRAIWQGFLDRWTAGPLTPAQQTARFAADGLWMAQVGQSAGLSSVERVRLLEMLHDLCNS